MGDAGFSVVSRAIEHHSALTLLDLSQNGISCTGMKSSMMYITALPHLQVCPRPCGPAHRPCEGCELCVWDRPHMTFPDDTVARRACPSHTATATAV